jgi:tannase/feruloyl esterase
MSRKKLTKASVAARQCAAPHAKGIGMGAALLALTSFGAAGTAQAATCESLAQASFPNTVITAAQSVTGSFTYPSGHQVTGLPASCHVTGSIRPTSDSDIRFDLWMPNENWNHKFLQLDPGGLGGNEEYADPNFLKRGYAIAGSDYGIQPQGVSSTNIWGTFDGPDHPEKVKDFAWRAEHLTSQISKLIITAFYEEAPRYSYFNSCSTGGQHAGTEAQRFDEDFDGIIMGDPALDFTAEVIGMTWDSQAWLLNPASYIPPSKLPAIQAASLSACGGTADGFLTDPRKCHFDPAALLCEAGDNNSCLTAPQVAALKAVYEGPRNPRTGMQIFPGLVRGGEDNLTLLSGTTGPDSLLLSVVNAFNEFFIFGPTFNWKTFNFDTDVATSRQIMDAVPFDARSADLSGLQKRGGKLISYHGWNDYVISPLESTEYYDRVVAQQTPGKGQGGGERRVGLKRTQDFFRLFMVPGMTHCAGGPGPNAFGQLFGGAPANDAQHDVLTALEQWVEKGIAPDQIIATKFVNDDPTQGIAMQRPLCPYPATQVYTSGPTNAASSFRCVAPSDQGDNNQH